MRSKEDEMKVKEAIGRLRKREEPLRDEAEALSLTLIQPITEAVEYHALFAGGNQTDDAALHRGPVVDVVLKYENLKRAETEGKKNLLLVNKKKIKMI